MGFSLLRGVLHATTPRTISTPTPTFVRRYHDFTSTFIFHVGWLFVPARCTYIVVVTFAVLFYSDSFIPRVSWIFTVLTLFSFPPYVPYTLFLFFVTVVLFRRVNLHCDATLRYNTPHTPHVIRLPTIPHFVPHTIPTFVIFIAIHCPWVTFWFLPPNPVFYLTSLL